ncbi:portal protein [Sphingomonas sp. LaA6.9]|uniref:portal protein n=1 Tax=Sphingomonas sp. LaA6.9 TaxID=2919914 RepID=UPI001F4FF3EC|nr:portal protein [Sphingomonas sp. LaA6.9]MCJ8158848.1 portal protein [Sphingomonas sp. LaA6.9]
MADDKLQDDDLVKAHLRNHERLAGERAPYESTWREIDERVDPEGQGAFGGGKTDGVRSERNFDVTASEGLERFQAAMASITVPRATQYIRLKFADENLNKQMSVRRWCERTADRLYAIRYAGHTGFETQAGADFRQLGKYGTGLIWTGVRPGVGLFYKALHLSECYIDEDYAGMVDTVQRKYERDVRQIEQEFGRDALTPKMRKAFDGNKLNERFQLLHIVCPNGDLQPGAMDRRGMPVDSITIAVDEKMVLRRKGFRSMPIATSRHVTGPCDKYGRSPAVKVLPSIRGLNTMKRTILRAAHKQADPALAFYDDDGITSIVTRPGGANPGLVDESGRVLVARMPGGDGNLPIGMEMIEQDRQVVRTAFLEDYFKLLTDEKVQRSAQAVLEIAAKQGVLVAPYAGRYETEKQNPMTQRDLELSMMAGQIEPFPPEVTEAGAYPMIEYDNPLNRMARSQEAAGLTRLIETLTPMAQSDPSVFDVINTDEAATGVADVLGVRPSWLRSRDEIAAVRKKRAEDEAVAAGVDQLATVASAYQDIAKGNQIAEAI